MMSRTSIPPSWNEWMDAFLLCGHAQQMGLTAVQVRKSCICCAAMIDAALPSRQVHKDHLHACASP